MKISKQEIEFFSSYISKDVFRHPLKSVFLDLSEIRTEAKPEGDIRYGQLVATNGFCLGKLEVQLSDSDKESYLIPYEHLNVAKGYLTRLEKLEVTKGEQKIFFITNKATITVEYMEGEKFPEYKKVIISKDPEYAVKIGIGELQNVLASFRKLGITNLLIKMIGNDKPISFDSTRSDVASILMPVHISDDKELGELQKLKNYPAMK